MIINVCMYCRRVTGRTYEPDRPEHLESHGVCHRRACRAAFARHMGLPLETVEGTRSMRASIPACQRGLT